MVKWISHRGESYDAPENTLAAFSLSRKRGTDGMECDVRLTADGFVVVAHDPTTFRMGSKCIDIESSTLEEVRSVTVNSAFARVCPGEQIPLLSETFACLGEGREYYIELKGGNPALIDAVKQIVEESGVDTKQIVFISFSKELISGMKKAMRQCRALWLDGLSREYGRVTSADLIRELKELGVDGVDACTRPDLDEELVSALHKEGFTFAVWTVDNPFMAERLISLGVDAVTSNRAALLKQWFAR